MGRREFPALGFDPAPGDPGAVEAAARGVDGAGRVFGDAAANVSRLNSSGWTGEAADAFRGQLKDLPRDLDLAARSHQGTARTLRTYAEELATRQGHAHQLETRAAELRRQHQAAITEVNRLAAHTAPQGSPELAALRSQYTAAHTRATTLGHDLEDILTQARRLLTDHQHAARSAATDINGHADAPYDEPGWLSRAWNSATGWIAEHADVLTTISGVLKGISAVLGVLSLVPGLQFLAPFAIAAGGIALALDIAVKLATGKGSWTAIGIDAALTFLPVGKVAGLIKRIPGVTPALKAANRAIPDSIKGRLFRAVGNLPEGVSAGQLDDAAGRIRSAVGDLGDDVIVQGSRAGHSARPTSDIDFGLRIDPLSVTFVLVNLVVDLLYGLINPRIRHQ